MTQETNARLLNRLLDGRDELSGDAFHAEKMHQMTRESFEEAKRGFVLQLGDNISTMVEKTADYFFAAGAAGAAGAASKVPEGCGTEAAISVLAERERQKAVEGWTPEHDDKHDAGDLAIAGACYAARASGRGIRESIPTLWPWAKEWWKPSTKRRDLVKAAALILAEIERIDRAMLSAAPTAPGETK